MNFEKAVQYSFVEDNLVFHGSGFHNLDVNFLM